MRFDLSGPCSRCPFRSDQPGYLRPDRAREIAETVLAGGLFACHKTTISSEDEDGECEMTEGPDTQECGGAVVFAAKHGRSSQLSRVMARLGVSVAEPNMLTPVFDTVEEMEEAQPRW